MILAGSNSARQTFASTASRLPVSTLTSPENLTLLLGMASPLPPSSVTMQLQHFQARMETTRSMQAHIAQGTSASMAKWRVAPSANPIPPAAAGTVRKVTRRSAPPISLHECRRRSKKDETDRPSTRLAAKTPLLDGSESRRRMIILLSNPFCDCQHNF